MALAWREFRGKSIGNTMERQGVRCHLHASRPMSLTHYDPTSCPLSQRGSADNGLTNGQAGKRLARVLVSIRLWMYF